MKKISGNKGFSLIEVLIAILIFTISLFAIIPLLFIAVNVDNDSLMKVTAQRMMTETIDDLMAQTTLAGFEDCICTNGVPAGTCPAGTCTTTRNGPGAINGNPINRTWTIVPATGNLSLITATVTYTQGGENKTLMTQVRKGL